MTEEEKEKIFDIAYQAAKQYNIDDEIARINAHIEVLTERIDYIKNTYMDFFGYFSVTNGAKQIAQIQDNISSLKSKLKTLNKKT
jgi:archaellum component FlaC